MKELHFFKAAFKQGITERGATYGRFTFFGVVLFVFSRLWQIVGDESNTTDPLWYLGMTELVVLSIPLVFLDVEDDVKTGNVAYLLIRPVSYLKSKFFEAMGLLVARMLILLPAAFGFCWLFSGELPGFTFSMLVFFPFALASGALYILFQLIVGVITFWTQDGTSLYMIIQKMIIWKYCLR